LTPALQFEQAGLIQHGKLGIGKNRAAFSKGKDGELQLGGMQPSEID